MLSTPSRTIATGDLVILYYSRQNIKAITVTPDQAEHSKFGTFLHNDMVGKPYGAKFPSTKNSGFVYLLKPTAELWTLALPHRTQILYQPDIAFITSRLDIKGGSVVIEAGTGSGSFSHSLARSVGSTGHVHSFEYNEERFRKATEEFKEHGLTHVTLRHSDVYQDGFGLENEADAVFLDLPAPWEALEHAKTSLRADKVAKICCFSPCIEQVIRCVAGLREHGFSDITMFETLTRAHEPWTISLLSIDTAIDSIKNIESKKERRRLLQISEAKRKREEGDAAGEDQPKRQRMPNPPNTREPLQKETYFKGSILARGHTSYLTFATLIPKEMTVPLEDLLVKEKPAKTKAAPKKQEPSEEKTSEQEKHVSGQPIASKEQAVPEGLATLDDRAAVME